MKNNREACPSYVMPIAVVGAVCLGFILWVGGGYVETTGCSVLSDCHSRGIELTGSLDPQRVLSAIVNSLPQIGR